MILGARVRVRLDGCEWLKEGMTSRVQTHLIKGRFQCCSAVDTRGIGDTFDVEKGQVKHGHTRISKSKSR
jgi:hypothetical protein